MTEKAKEVDGMLRRLRIEAQASRRTTAEVVEMALAGKDDQAVGEGFSPPSPPVRRR
jgi:hypothetical protein